MLASRNALRGQRLAPLAPRSPSVLLLLLLVTIGAMIYWWPNEPGPSGPPGFSAAGASDRVRDGE